MLTRKRTPLSADLTFADCENASLLHQELAEQIRRVASRSLLPRDMMALIVVHPGAGKKWLAEKLEGAGFIGDISLEPDVAPVISCPRDTVRRAFAGTDFAEFFDGVAAGHYGVIYGLEGGRWFCAELAELPQGRGQA